LVSPHYEVNMHMPERFPYLQFSTERLLFLLIFWFKSKSKIILQFIV